MTCNVLQTLLNREIKKLSRRGFHHFPGTITGLQFYVVFHLRLFAFKVSLHLPLHSVCAVAQYSRQGVPEGRPHTDLVLRQWPGDRDSVS